MRWLKLFALEKQGRGFTVVAQEVKALSQQTSDATGEVTAANSGDPVTHASRPSAAIESVRETINEMAEVTGYVASSMDAFRQTPQATSHQISAKQRKPQKMSRAKFTALRRRLAKADVCGGSVC